MSQRGRKAARVTWLVVKWPLIVIGSVYGFALALLLTHPVP